MTFDTRCRIQVKKLLTDYTYRNCSTKYGGMHTKLKARRKLRDRLKKGVGLANAASEIGVARQTLSEKLNSDKGDFTESQLEILSKLSGYSLAEIVYGKEEDLDPAIAELVILLKSQSPELVEGIVQVVKAAAGINNDNGH